MIALEQVLRRICLNSGLGYAFNPRPAGVFSRTRPAGGGGIFCPSLPNSRTNRRSEAGEAAIESLEREDANAY